MTAVYSTSRAFAALRQDGSVTVWGSIYYGGDNSAVAANTDGNIADGSVITWGAGTDMLTSARINYEIKEIYSNLSSFALIKQDGSVVEWGDSDSWMWGAGI